MTYERTPEHRARMRVAKRNKQSVRERLLERSIPEPNTGCWFWLGSLDGKGYGQMSVEGRLRRTHRLAYEEFVGPIPAGLEPDHLCRTPACINPLHLEPVTHAENARRSEYARRRRNQIICKRGHDLADARLTPAGHRACRPCAADRLRRWRERHPRP